MNALQLTNELLPVFTALGGLVCGAGLTRAQQVMAARKAKRAAVKRVLRAVAKK